VADNYSATTANHTEQRWKLGIAPARQERPSHVQTTPVSAIEKIQVCLQN
jgi:synaptosomal-associated protein 25